MADKDIPDFMRGFDITEDWGMTPVSSKYQKLRMMCHQ